MKVVLLNILFITFFSISYAQVDTLSSSIGYLNTYGNSPNPNELKVDYNYWPKDLDESTLLFIHIIKEEMKGNVGVMGPYASGINDKVINTMMNSYPYNFDHLPNHYRNSGREYLLEHGYKYRLLIQSNWYTVEANTSNYTPRTDWAQSLGVVIEDVETGKKYRGYDRVNSPNYLKKFIKSLKKGYKRR